MKKELAEAIIAALHEEGAYENEPGVHVLKWNKEDVDKYEQIIVEIFDEERSLNE